MHSNHEYALIADPASLHT